MKSFLKLSLVLLTLVLFNKHAYSCDALNIEIGSQISKASEVLDFLDEHYQENYKYSAPLKSIILLDPIKKY